MKMYIYRPEGFGQETYIVMEESEEKALERIKEYAGDDPWDWSVYHMEVYKVGEVASNGND